MRNDPESGKTATHTGFNTEFLATPINLPDHRSDIAEDLVQINGSHIIDYAHFSLVVEPVAQVRPLGRLEHQRRPPAAALPHRHQLHQRPPHPGRRPSRQRPLRG